MKLREMFRFEFSQQLRKAPTWIYFLLLVFIAYSSVRNDYIDGARHGDFLINSPFVIAGVTVLGSLVWLWIAAAVAGHAAARDVQTRMHPLIYTSPISKAEYLGGRFLAAFAVNALIQLAVPAGILLALYLPGVESEILGPSRLASYLCAFVFIALPNAFVATAIQFSLAALNRRAVAAYLGSLFLFGCTYLVAGLVSVPLHQPEIGKLLDPIGVVNIWSNLSRTLTTVEKNTKLIGLEGPFLLNRFLWIAVGVAMLVFAHRRFRFSHPAIGSLQKCDKKEEDTATPVSVPQVQQTFGFETQFQQVRAIAWTSYQSIARSKAGLVLLAVIAILAGLFMLGHMNFLDVPLFPRTQHILSFFIAPLTDGGNPWMLIPLLTIFYAGETVSKEKEARLNEITDAAPVPEWSLFIGKFFGLSLILIVFMAMLMVVGMLVQLILGYFHFEIDLYLRVLFGMQLIDYLLFALLALVIHMLVGEKYLGHLVALVAYGCIAFAFAFGIKHNLLIYGSDPGWSYTDMRGFGNDIGPWLWFKLYWVVWALLLAVIARLFWVRGREKNFKTRFQLAKHRFTLATGFTAAIAVGLIVAVGGFIFYNTNVLNKYNSPDRTVEKYKNVPQPWLTAVDLQVDIYPKKSAVEIRGTYHLINKTPSPIDSIHIATDPEIKTGPITFNHAFASLIEDDTLGHRIYKLNQPLQPGDSLQLNFSVSVQPQGFTNRTKEQPVFPNGAYFTNEKWFPAIGYQLRTDIPSLYDVQARQHRPDAERIAFNAVISTDKDQTAIAPGILRRRWTANGRQYFHYSTNEPIFNEYAFYSGNYEMIETKYDSPYPEGKDIPIQIFYYPGHKENIANFEDAASSALSFCSFEYGDYPYSLIRLIERPGNGYALHADAMNISYYEGIASLNAYRRDNVLNLPYSVVAHEVAHQWWGAAQYRPAYMEGSPFISESIAQYTAMWVVWHSYGPEQSPLLKQMMHTTIPPPTDRVLVPLLRANNDYLAYRKGPLALYALGEYIGRNNLNKALRNFLEKARAMEAPLPTSLDLYHELKAATPPEMQYLLHDLFETNTFWDLKTEMASAKQAKDGWQVTIKVKARKVIVNGDGSETEVPINDFIQLGVYAPAKNEDGSDMKYLDYFSMHHITSKEQTFIVRSYIKPIEAAIDPENLLIEVNTEDNVKKVKF